jgi:hypothetical protein
MTAETVGEGFAFFRWHMLRWSDEWCWCKQHPDYLCYNIWVQGRNAR